MAFDERSRHNEERKFRKELLLAIRDLGSEIHANHQTTRELRGSIMALADAIAALTTSVEDAVTELRSLADQVANEEDTQAASDQINQLATNLEQAVNDAKADPEVPTPPDDGTTTPTDPGAGV